MYKKNATLKLILFFVAIAVIDQMALHAGRRFSRKTIERQRDLDRLRAEQQAAQAEEQEKQRIERDIALAEEAKAKMLEKQSIAMEGGVETPEKAKQKGFLEDVKKGANLVLNPLSSMTQSVAQSIMDNKGKIAAAAATALVTGLGVAALTQKHDLTKELYDEDMEKATPEERRKRVKRTEELIKNPPSNYYASEMAIELAKSEVERAKRIYGIVT